MDVLTITPVAQKVMARLDSRESTNFYVLATLRCTMCGDVTTEQSPDVELRVKDREPSAYVYQGILAISKDRKCSKCGFLSGVPDRQLEEIRRDLNKTVTVDWIEYHLQQKWPESIAKSANHKPRLSQDALAEVLAKARKQVPTGSIWVHYKNPNNQYRVVAIALIEDSELPTVIYRSLQEKKLTWSRPLNDFLAKVEGKPDHQPRFRRVPQPKTTRTK